MIWDSSPWKDELVRSAEKLSRVEQQKRLTQRALLLVEREIAIGCYVIRKLVEAHKVSDSTKELACKAQYFRNRKPAYNFNWHRLEELYDMERGTEGVITLVSMCNQVIHSYVFLMGEIEKGERGIFVASDLDRNKKVTFIRLIEIIKIFRTVGQDYPSKIHWTKDPRTGEEKITAQNGLLDPTSK